MSNLSGDEIMEDFFRAGAFVTIHDLVAKRRLSDQEAIQWTELVFESYVKMINEAKKEIGRLSAVLSRLENAAKAGTRMPRGGTWASIRPRIQALAHEVSTFDNWVMSLYETDLSMIALARPDRAMSKPHELAKAFEQLRMTRFKAKKFGLKDPSLFKRN